MPDPTSLTTQQLVGAISSLREIIETRLDGMDKAIELLQRTADMLPDYMDEKVTHLKEVNEVKFESIQTQFKERDVRTDQTSRDAKTAVDAALQAAKEAVGKQNDSFAIATQKSEDGFTRQIEQLGRLLETASRSLDGKIDDLKERLTRVESVAVGAVTERQTQQATTSTASGLVFGVIGSLVGVAGLIATLVVVASR